ncbi:hypothetical protein [Streptococcus suis]|uniref:hypothetical protein n=1 Tax=Streptococcus suis TaxID=1307 RepID=UPI00209A6C51|nr:hypothetical protein [Streptococcus suis]MCO8175158.1 hypothetical protein [Streptococcus suis]MCO8209043.1 hypothetical protein [Streptococcus suis]HEM3488537.1 hypothetical protein [Streptococcus suis]HEM3507238.1 hypothetical protein [Streptococcus suis]
MKNNKFLIFITDIEVIERISSIIMEFLLFLINLKPENNSKWTIFFSILLILMIGFTIFKLWKLWIEKINNVFTSSDEVKEYMRKWINKPGQTVIVTRDMSWISTGDEIYNILLDKAKKKELTIVLEETRDPINNLKNSGAKVLEYKKLSFTPKTRFTFIHYGTSNPKVAIGYPDGDMHRIKEFEKSGTIEYSLAEDLLKLLEKVSVK